MIVALPDIFFDAEVGRPKLVQNYQKCNTGKCRHRAQHSQQTVLEFLYKQNSSVEFTKMTVRPHQHWGGEGGNDVCHTSGSEGRLPYCLSISLVTWLERSMAAVKSSLHSSTRALIASVSAAVSAGSSERTSESSSICSQTRDSGAQNSLFSICASKGKG
jgi:hypothetical protein